MTYRNAEYRAPDPYKLQRTDGAWVWFGLVLGLALALMLCGCKKDKHRGMPEAASDGKTMISGCVWMLTRDDDIAFCDDGRVCVSDHNEKDWKCVQFVKPQTIDRCPENSSAPPPRDDGAGALRPRGP